MRVTVKTMGTPILGVLVATIGTVSNHGAQAWVLPTSTSSSTISSMRSSSLLLSPSSPRVKTMLGYGSEKAPEDSMPDLISFQSPVLKQLYPHLLEWKKEYGHPNIPLGSSEGRQCQTLRRLHIQNKLTADEVAWLDDLGFTFHSLEDVYKFADFDDLFQRLLDYEAKHPESNFQVPKKCPEDPELGAWVTGIRRLGTDGVNPEHERRLNEIGFVWKSTRKCGSKFMLQYREYVARADQEGLDAILAEPATLAWIKAQKEALKKGKLSQTRVHYMGQLFGDSWTTLGQFHP